MCPMPIADQHPSVEFFSSRDWEAILCNRHRFKALNSLSSSSDPFLEHAYSLPVPVVWGFSGDALVPNVLNIIDDLDVFQELEAVRAIQLAQREFFSRWVAALSVLGPGSDLKQVLEEVRNLLVDHPLQKSIIDSEVLISSIRENYTGHWMKFKSMWFFYLHALDQRDLHESPSHETVVRSFLTFIYDATILQNSVKANIPWDQISQQGKTDPARFERIFFDPQEFRVWKERGAGDFLWPWQRCMYVADADDNVVELSEIGTTSIVGDLRFSTQAMLQFSPPEAYAAFLDEVFEACHRLLLKSGAYYDKETGDGFVAHYCTSNFEVQDHGENADVVEIENAVYAGISIVKEVSKISTKYQRFMKQGLSNVQMSIGIHSENAAWLCNRRQVRAIGPSVVHASRLCGTAKPLEILISNWCYQRLIASGSPLVAGLRKRDISMKEIDDGAEPYAFGLCELDFSKGEL